MSLFPDADPEYVRELITSTGNPYPVNVTCNILLENPQYPHIKKKETNKGPDSAQGFTVSSYNHSRMMSLAMYNRSSGLEGSISRIFRWILQSNENLTLFWNPFPLCRFLNISFFK